MKLSELKGTQIISGRGINDVKTTMSSIERKLNKLKARTSITENKIDFSTIKITIPASGYDDAGVTLLRIYKEGNIIIDKMDAELRIAWTVKLDTLYAMALSIAFVSLMISSFVLELFFSIVVGITVFFAVVFTGIIIIMLAMNDLISLSTYKD